MKRTLLAALAAVLLSTGAGARGTELFASNDVLEITLEGEVAAAVSDRSVEAPYRPVVLRYTGADGQTVELDAGLRARGNFRRQKKICSFPPLRLNLKKSQLEGTVFAGQDKLKLVTHCREKSRYFDQLAHEYLAYRLLNTLTDRSYRARMLKVRYVMTDRKGETIERPGFFIEPDKVMARRHGGRVRRDVEIGHADLEPAHASLVELFHYLIGNTDWSMIRSGEEGDCCHNHRLLTEDDQLYYAVPYDFDFAGLVNAPYAEPNENFKIRNVRQRLYRGRCSRLSGLPATLAAFNAAKPELYALFAAESELRPKTIARAHRYLDRFYATINDDASRGKQIEAACVGQP